MAFGRVRRPTKRLDCKNNAVVRYKHNNNNQPKKKKNNNKRSGGGGVKSVKRKIHAKEHSKDKVKIFTSYLYKQLSTRQASPLHVAEGRRIYLSLSIYQPNLT